jgi:hypothetical protein
MRWSWARVAAWADRDPSRSAAEPLASRREGGASQSRVPCRFAVESAIAFPSPGSKRYAPAPCGARFRSRARGARARPSTHPGPRRPAPAPARPASLPLPEFPAPRIVKEKDDRLGEGGGEEGVVTPWSAAVHWQFRRRERADGADGQQHLPHIPHANPAFDSSRKRPLLSGCAGRVRLHGAEFCGNRNGHGSGHS